MIFIIALYCFSYTVPEWVFSTCFSNSSIEPRKHPQMISTLPSFVR